MPTHPLRVLPETLARFGLADAEAAAREISDLLEGAFGPFDPELAEAWRLTDEPELTLRESEKMFRKAAEAENPLAYLSERSRLARVRLNAWVRVRWAARDARAAGHPRSLCGLTWTELSDLAGETVRDGLRHLATHDAAQVRRGPPNKNRIDTVLDGLAEIYARHTGCTDSHRTVAHAERSHFIQFALTMLSPHLPLTEAAPGAISQKWRRFKLATEGTTGTRRQKRRR